MDRTHLVKAVDMLGMFKGEMDEAVKEIKRQGLNEALTEWFLTREDYEVLDTIRKELNLILEGMSRITLPEMMSEQDTKTITIASLRRRFTVSQRVSCSIVEGKKQDAFEWLREKGEGAIIQETINSSTLAAWAKAWAQDKGMDVPVELFKVNVMNVTSATKI